MSEQTQDRSSGTGEYPTLPPARGSRLLLPMRLAVRFVAGGDLTDRIRFLLTVVTIALSVSVVLLTVVSFAALTQREDQADALTPHYVDPSWAPMTAVEDTPSTSELLRPAGRFWVSVDDEPFRGIPLTITTIARPVGATGAILPPPGTAAAPGPGEAVVSPALADLLASPAGEDLRSRLPQVVVGTVATPGLLDDGDLRAYVGAVKTFDPADESATGVAIGWGIDDLPSELRTGAPLRILLLAGAVVVITPLLVLIGLLSRLAGPARERRSAALRLLGAPGATVRAVAIGESVLLGAGGALVAAAAFPLVRRTLVGIRIDGLPLSDRALSVSAPLVVGGALLAGLLAALAGSIGLDRPLPRRRSGRASRSRSPRWWPGLMLLAGGLLLIAQGLSEGGLYGNHQMLLVVCAGLAGTLVSVALLAGPAVTAAARPLRRREPLCTLAVARIGADPRSRAATVAGVGVVLAGAIALQAVLALVAADRTATAQATAPAYRVYLTADRTALTVADVGAVVDTLAAAPGVDRITGGFFLPGEFGEGSVTASDGSIDTSQTVDALVAPCRAIPEKPDCRDGDVYRLITAVGDGTSTADPPAGTVIRFAGSAAWTLPTVTGSFVPDRMLRGGSLYNYLVTPGALDALADLPASAASKDLRAFGAATSDTADLLRSELTGQGWRVQLDTTAESTGARAALLAVGRAGLTGTAALTVLATLGGLLVLTFAQVSRNRRAVALALAAGWPRAVLRRSFVIEAAISAVAVVPIATAVAYGLAAVLTQLGRPATDLPNVGTTALLALGATLVTVLAAWVAAALAVRTVDVSDLRTG